MLPGVNFKVHFQHFWHNVISIAEKHMFKGCLHLHLSAESLQNREGSGMGWKHRAPSSDTPQGKTRNKTHADSREMM